MTRFLLALMGLLVSSSVAAATPGEDAANACKAAFQSRLADAADRCVALFGAIPVDDPARVNTLPAVLYGAGRKDAALAELDRAVAADAGRTGVPLATRASLYKALDRPIAALDGALEARDVAARTGASWRADAETMITALEASARGLVSYLSVSRGCAPTGLTKKSMVESGSADERMASARRLLVRCSWERANLPEMIAQSAALYDRNLKDCRTARARATQDVCARLNARIEEIANGPRVKGGVVSDDEVARFVADDEKLFDADPRSFYDGEMKKHERAQWPAFGARLRAAPAPSVERDCGPLYRKFPESGSSAFNAYLEAKKTDDTRNPHVRYLQCLDGFGLVGNPYKDTGDAIYPASQIARAAKLHRRYEAFRCSKRPGKGCIPDEAYAADRALLSDALVATAERLTEAYKVEWNVALKREADFINRR